MIHYKKGRVIIRSVVESDLQYLANNLRASDIAEIRASHDQSPEQALRFSAGRSTWCAAVLHKGKPVAIFGLVPDDKADCAASVWFLATDGLLGMWATFLRLSRKIIETMLEKYPFLYNFVDDRNEKSIIWLKWCGATIDEPRPYGAAGLPFRFFAIARGKPNV